MDWMEERRGEERGIGGRDSSSISFLKGMRQNLQRSQSTNKRQELGCKSDSLVIFIPREQRKGGLLSSLLALFPFFFLRWRRQKSTFFPSFLRFRRRCRNLRNCLLHFSFLFFFSILTFRELGGNQGMRRQRRDILVCSHPTRGGEGGGGYKPILQPQQQRGK